MNLCAKKHLETGSPGKVPFYSKKSEMGIHRSKCVYCNICEKYFAVKELSTAGKDDQRAVCPNLACQNEYLVAKINKRFSVPFQTVDPLPFKQLVSVLRKELSDVLHIMEDKKVAWGFNNQEYIQVTPKTWVLLYNTKDQDFWNFDFFSLKKKNQKQGTYLLVPRDIHLYAGLSHLNERQIFIPKKILVQLMQATNQVCKFFTDTKLMWNEQQADLFYLSAKKEQVEYEMIWEKKQNFYTLHEEVERLQNSTLFLGQAVDWYQNSVQNLKMHQEMLRAIICADAWAKLIQGDPTISLLHASLLKLAEKIKPTLQRLQKNVFRDIKPTKLEDIYPSGNLCPYLPNGIKKVLEEGKINLLSSEGELLEKLLDKYFLHQGLESLVYVKLFIRKKETLLQTKSILYHFSYQLGVCNINN